jgi:hypothetical protein
MRCCSELQGWANGVGVLRDVEGDVSARDVNRGVEAVELAALDVDISVVGLLRDLAGSLGCTAAAELGRRGGSVRSAQKTAAVRANGAKGGRPRKNAPPKGKPTSKTRSARGRKKAASSSK